MRKTENNKVMLFIGFIILLLQLLYYLFEKDFTIKKTIAYLLADIVIILIWISVTGIVLIVCFLIVKIIKKMIK